MKDSNFPYDKYAPHTKHAGLKLGDIVTYNKILEKDCTVKNKREHTRGWVQSSVPTKKGIVVGKRTLRSGFYTPTHTWKDWETSITEVDQGYRTCEVSHCAYLVVNSLNKKPDYVLSTDLTLLNNGPILDYLHEKQSII